jgi:gluconokinase
MSRVVVVMGVSGSGKTTVAKLLAAELGWTFQEGDVLHPAANVAKMAAGTPLTDKDRAPWLAIIAAWITERLKAEENGLITCSALKRSYREQLGNGKPGVQIVYLHGDRATLCAHVGARHHEFMPVSLLDSQLATLEEPAPDEHVIAVDVGGTVDHTVAEIVRQLET